MTVGIADQLAAAAASYGAEVLASPRQMVAAVAVVLGIALVMAGALVRTMMPLRWLAAASDLALIVYGVLSPSYSTLAAALLLLPMNIYRAVEVTRLARRVRSAAAASDHVRLWLKPYMKARKLKAGQTLFKKGDRAEHLFLLVDGQLELAEIGKPIEQGRIFGEIALFSPSGTRTQTVRAVQPCTVLQIDDSTVKQLYYQEPAFGFHLISLLADRLSSDVERTQARVTGASPLGPR